MYLDKCDRDLIRDRAPFVWDDVNNPSESSSAGYSISVIEETPDGEAVLGIFTGQLWREVLRMREEGG